MFVHLILLFGGLLPPKIFNINNMIQLKIIRLLLFFILFISCDNSREEITKADDFQFVVPPHFPEPTYTFRNNPINKAGFELGKKLFNDPILSKDNSVACANCHAKAVAFSDPQHDFSVGVGDRIGLRNAPAIQNMAFMNEFFWDGGVVHLDFVPTNAIENPLEMNETLSNVVQKLNRIEEYRLLFKKAFGNIDSINAPLMLHAFSQYMNMLISANSKYDQYYLGKTQLTENEQSGLALFKKHCESCHSGVLFTNQGYANNGIDSIFMDLGRANISEGKEDIGKFKIPSLRNVSLTAPYMHNAKFKTLAEVLNHYANGVKDSPTLDARLKKDNKLGISISPEEQQRIIDFLSTLTDRDFISNELF